MKTEKLNSWLTLGANVGVLIGIILLVYEIRQNSHLMRAQMSQNRADAGSALITSFMDSPYLPVIRVKLENDQELTQEETIRYMYYFRSCLVDMNNNYWQHDHGFLGDEIPRSVSDIGKRLIGRGEIGLELWDQYKSEYTDEFVAFVEEAIADLR